MILRGKDETGRGLSRLSGRWGARGRVEAGGTSRGRCGRRVGGGRAGIALIDCLIYLVVLVLLFGLALAAFLETLRHSTELDRLAGTTVRALQAGEQWREDVRALREAPRLVDVEGASELRLPVAGGEISYAWRAGAMWRRASAAGPWLEVLDSVKASRFREDARRQVRAWCWELELARRRDSRGFRRVLTFYAVPGREAKP